MRKKALLSKNERRFVSFLNNLIGLKYLFYICVLRKQASCQILVLILVYKPKSEEQQYRTWSYLWMKVSSDYWKWKGIHDSLVSCILEWIVWVVPRACGVSWLTGPARAPSLPLLPASLQLDLFSEQTDLLYVVEPWPPITPEFYILWL